MKKILASFLLLLFLGPFFSPKLANAADSCSPGIKFLSGSISSTYYEGDPNGKIDVTLGTLQSNQEYSVKLWGSAPGGSTLESEDFTSDGSGVLDVLITDPGFFEYRWGLAYDEYILELSGPGISGSCELGRYSVPFPYQCGNISVSQNYGGNTCYAGGGGCIAAGNSTKFTVTVLNSFGTPASGVPIIVNINSGIGANDEPCTTNASGTCSVTMSGVENQSNSLVVEYNDAGNTNICSTGFIASVACQPDECSEEEVFIYNGSAFSGGEDPYILCNQINRAKFEPQYQDCIACTGGETEEDQEGVWTAIGCIKKAPAEIAQSLIRVGLMMGGGAALLTMLAAGFILSVSQGDPKRTEEAKDMITAAFIGLIFILFSVSILQFIGFSILKIPGFGG